MGADRRGCESATEGAARRYFPLGPTDVSDDGGDRSVARATPWSIQPWRDGPTSGALCVNASSRAADPPAEVGHVGSAERPGRSPGISGAGELSTHRDLYSNNTQDGLS